MATHSVQFMLPAPIFPSHLTNSYLLALVREMTALHLRWTSLPALWYFFLSLLIYFERERLCVWAGWAGGRERERGRPSQAPHHQCRRFWSHKPQDHDLSQDQELGTQLTELTQEPLHHGIDSISLLSFPLMEKSGDGWNGAIKWHSSLPSVDMMCPCHFGMDILGDTTALYSRQRPKRT